MPDENENKTPPAEKPPKEPPKAPIDTDSYKSERPDKKLNF
jgi:hypothetical protein